VEFFDGDNAFFACRQFVYGVDAMKSVWFAYIALIAVVVAAIAAVVASGLGAPALTVVPWSAGSFVVTFGLGFTVYNYFRTP